MATSNAYSELGIAQGQLAPKLTLQAFYNITPFQRGSLSIGYILQANRQTIPSVPFTLLTSRETTSSLVTLSYNHNLFNNLYFSLSSLFDTNHSSNNQAVFSLTWAFLNEVTVTSSERYQHLNTNQIVDITKNLPFGNGYGYRLHAATSKHDPLEGDFGYQNNYGSYKGKIARYYNTMNYQFEGRGGIVRFGNTTSFSREIQQSFALVKVPGVSNVAVYNRNQVVGYTDSKGDLFIPYLLPYQANDIRIEPKDLPLDTQLNKDQKKVTPYFRSGILVTFPVKRIRSVIFKLLLTNSKNVPSGAVIEIDSNNNYYFVGDNGLVYIDNVPINQWVSGIAKWDNKLCYFRFNPPITGNLQTDIGQISCKFS